MITHALIPAAGRGARLDRPGTPKPLVDVGGQALILRLLRQLEAVGVRTAWIVLGYAAERIQRALTGLDLSLELRFLHHPGWEAGLASSLLCARGQIPGPFLLAMADHIFDDSHLQAIAAAPVEPDGVVCLVDPDLDAVFDLPAAVKVQRQGDRITAIDRALAPADAVDAGLFLATPALFEALAAADGDDLSHGVAWLAARGRARALPLPGGAFDDVDTPAALIHAELRLRQARRVARVGAPGPAPAPAYQFYTGGPRRTDIHLSRGALADPGLIPLIPAESASSPVFVFTDETVNGLYAERFVARLRDRGYTVHAIVMADGEASKTLACYTWLIERVLRQGIDERSVLISVGGGAVCNVCGFIASTLYRGVALVHVPTTLMAQCDAAISHKQAVNGVHGKNLVGSYYAPARIIVDVDALATLDDRQLCDGVAEILKHALAQDAAFADQLLSAPPNLRDPAFLEAIVRRNIQLKCALMATDPQEHREGMVLQYGHEIGHPIEHLSGYTITHGESVAIGMQVAARIARLLGACDDGLVALHRRLLERYGLPTHVPANLSADDILKTMRYNKRTLTEGNRMALLSGLGRLWSVDGEHAIPVSDAIIRRAIEETRA